MDAATAFYMQERFVDVLYWLAIAFGVVTAILFIVAACIDDRPKH